MKANDLNVALLEVVAERLGDDLREEMVFVGGEVAGLLITDPADRRYGPRHEPARLLRRPTYRAVCHRAICRARPANGVGAGRRLQRRRLGCYRGNPCRMSSYVFLYIPIWYT